MSRASELAELHHLIGGVRSCVASLQAHYGEGPAMRRVVLDTERLLADLELLDMDARELEVAPHEVAASVEKIPVPDTPYDREFWRDVDDEGVGGSAKR
ncbi:MAG TPA: hypothetical protein PLH92_17425 [Mycobacterium sp.]|uniref:hypothetical protein n=1 Tax=Mycolicibacterium sp. TaxID=2320850 RepID=UPI0025E95D52|nr:hypothetical protein [Mycolicibacterium sp.]HPX38645.1 hypothetical protein [Mycobacterium sp.]HQC78490.1 hypothetical protein [Mycobacterium sp.]